MSINLASFQVLIEKQSGAGAMSSTRRRHHATQGQDYGFMSSYVLLYTPIFIVVNSYLMLSILGIEMDLCV